MHISKRFLTVLALCVAGTGITTGAEKSTTFDVRGANPGGKGGYTGEVTVTELTKTTGKIRWVTGDNKETTEGIAIKSENVIGAAYGGAGLYALAAYEIRDGSIKALWMTAATPTESAKYELKGTDFAGTLPFADGSAGGVTFTPGQDGLYRVSWRLPSGNYEGIGIRMGDVMVAASGDLKKGFGLAGYVPKGSEIEGRWALSNSTSPGTETWSLKAAGAGPKTGDAGRGLSAPDGGSVKFAGETYVLKEKKSAPGQATSELREYLRTGENFEGYRKMVAVRRHVLGQDAATVARSVLGTVLKKHPGSYTKEILMTPDAAAFLFILVVGDDVELNLWRYKRAPGGLASAQFVLRNKAPYETQKKFKAEQDKNFDDWQADLSTLADEADALVAASANTPLAPEPAMSDAELAKAIKADLDTCGKLAQKFMTHLVAGEVDQAVAVMHDNAFTKTTRAAFTQSILESNKIFGALKNFKPDRDAKSFEMKEGVMNFILQADSDYENAKVREVLRFVRGSTGDIQFIGYSRTAK